MNLKKIISKIHPYYILFVIKIAIQNNYLKLTLNRKGKLVKIWGKITVLNPHNIIIDDYSHINENVLLNAREKIKIGKYCHLSQFVQIQSTGLETKIDFKKRKHQSKPVILKDGVWLCSNVIINPGIIIESGSIILSGSVVTKNIPPFEMWGGIPAKFIKKLS